MSTVTEIFVPEIGDFSDIPVVEIMVAVGDQIEEDDPILMLESDKATLEVPSPSAGTLTEIVVSEGDSVSEGSLIARIEVVNSNATAASEKTVESAAPEEPKAVPSEAKAPAEELRPAASVPTQAPITNPTAQATSSHASPSVRKFARELGAQLDQIAGTGRKGRITRDDVTAFIKAKLQAPTKKTSPSGSISDLGLPEWPKVDFEKFGPVNRQKLSRIAKISGPALARNSMVIPHVCNFDEADITDLEAFRKLINSENRDGFKMSILAFVVKAVVAALKDHPKFNTSLDGDELIVKEYYHIGVAADTPDGLVVPVIKNADQKSVTDIAAEMVDLATTARNGKLKPADMQGGTFTISSLGGIGGTGFVPIINAPEVAILGMTRSNMKAVWNGQEFTPRLVQPMSLSWDHRVVDGVAAAKFLKRVTAVLNDFRRYNL